MSLKKNLLNKIKACGEAKLENLHYEATFRGYKASTAERCLRDLASKGLISTCRNHKGHVTGYAYIEPETTETAEISPTQHAWGEGKLSVKCNPWKN